MKVVLALLLLFPLVGALINALGGRSLPRRVVEVVACGAIVGAFVLAVIGFALLWEKTYFAPMVDWIVVGNFSASFSVLYNPLAAVMALMVTFVSSIIHLYSVTFMREEDEYARYFCYLNLFVFAMLVITLSDSLFFFYLGWEGVGFCSYALIGFWYEDPANATAGRKALITTRIGDIAFGIALALIFVLFGNFSLSYIYDHTGVLSTGLATVLGLLLLWAAIGKSAQLPLTVWLPDAMAGPTPVSALIHAATMVTAGAYLLMRTYPVVSLSPIALTVIAGVGAITTFYAAAAALAQRDIKRVLAYSTISQVGYMVLGVGAMDIVGGMFHLLSHAFFKSLLFLSAGYVIQACAEEHDIHKMGNLRRLLPHVFWPFLIGALALSAFPMIGGFFSKDRILLATFIGPGLTYKIFWGFATVAAFMTPLYTFRMFFLVFQDRPDGRTAEEIQPVPSFMAYVLWPLALLAFCDGLLNLPFGPGKDWLAHYFSPVVGARVELGAPPGYELGMGVGSAAVILAVIAFTYFLYRPPGPTFNAPGWQAMLFEAFYLDKFYLYCLAGPYRWLARFWWQYVDEGGIDRGLDGTANGIDLLSKGLGFWTTGRLSTYLRMLLLGLTAFFLAVVLSWVIR